VGARLLHHSGMARYLDRRDAGRRLAVLLAPFKGGNTVVLGLPRGGVIVAAECAEALGAPLDVLVARKIGAPHQPEYAIGAVAPGGIVLLDDDAIAALALAPGFLDGAVAEATAEMARRETLYRDGRSALAVSGRTAIVVDDGLATGFTAAAALASLRRLDPERLVFAAPVCAPASGKRLDVADEVICARTPLMFRAVGEWYDRFDQTTDEEVIGCLRAARHLRSAAEG